ncbi:MAG: FKBP-type peptidyl-prolyl cis-trans isomerase [Coraliomargaritaceae bacterium]
MLISEDTVVSMDYTLKDDSGEVIDQSQPGQPLVYLHGHKNIIPGLESQLEGKTTGDAVEVRVAPMDGYGEVNPQLEQVVPRERFEGVHELSVGMQFQASTEQGPVSVRVTKVEGDSVTVDGNHPLAGQHLNFSVTIQNVREATQTEKDHGHVHAESSGCCGGGSAEEGAGGGCGCN